MFSVKTSGELRAVFSIPSWVDDSEPMLLHTGDLYLEGDLLLDWNAGWENGAQGVRGFCVDGSLRVGGALINADSDSGPLLLVAGSLHARQASCGGAFIEIGATWRWRRWYMPTTTTGN